MQPQMQSMCVGSAGVLLSSIVIKFLTKVCVKRVEYSSWSLLQCTICDSNFLSHTAQFSASRKVWNHACSSSSCAHFSTEHNRSLHQTAGTLSSNRILFRLGIAIPSPCRPCMSLCIRAACIQKRQLAHGSST